MAGLTRLMGSEVTADEQTPLLGVPDTAVTEVIGSDIRQDNGDTGVGRSPEIIVEEQAMPVGQVVLLCFAAMIEPISYFTIFPIIGDMLVHTGGLPVDSISIWSGYIEGIFSVVQMSVMITYGMVSDRIGRRPVLIFSLFGITGATALFGMAQSLWQMILLRSLTGLFAGSSVTIRAMLSEVTTKKTQATAFSWYMFSRNLGIFVGPLIGGSLANPQKNISFLHDNTFFKQFPYSLSMFATAIVCLVAALTTLLFVKETLRSKLETSKAAPERLMTTGEILRSPGVPVVVYIYGHVTFLALVFTAVNPVFDYTPVRLGGLGLTTQKIGILVALAGASQAAWMLGPFPVLQRRYGTGAVLRVCAMIWPFFMASSPLMNELRRYGQDTIFWVSVFAITMFASSVAMAFACVQLCLNDIAPSSNALGTLNAIALTVASGLRAVAPIIGTSLYELGVKLQWIDGHLIWVFLVGIALALNIGVRYLPEKAEGKPDKDAVVGTQ